MARLAPPWLLVGAILALEIVPGAGANAGATYEEAVAALRTGEFETAAALFENLLEGSPDWAAGHVAFAQCLFLLGDPTRAEEHLAAARGADAGTDLFRAYLGPGELLLGKRRWAEAAVPLERALALATAEQRPSVALRLGQAWLLGGEPARARQLLEELARSETADGSTPWLLAEAQRATGDYDAALETLRAARGRDADAGMAGRRLEALAQWSYYRALMPRNASRRDSLLTQALEDARPWIESDPQNPRAQASFADAALAAGHPDEVVRRLTPLLETTASCSTRLHLARAYNASSDSVSAEHHARAAVGCDPADAAARVELATSLILRLGAEYSELDEVIRDREVVDAALDELREAARLDTEGRTRAGTLLAQTELTHARLAESEAVLREQDEANAAAIDRANDEAVLERCRVVHWLLRDESRTPSEEDRSFYKRNDCASRIHGAGGSARAAREGTRRESSP